MAKSYFLGFGATQLSSDYYGLELILKDSQSDVDNMEIIAKERDFEVKTFKNEKATVGQFRIQMDNLCDKLEAGDVLWFYFSGFGSRVKNLASKKPLNSYCFFDGQIADFELLNWIAGLSKGVDVVVMLDCSHFPLSGGKTLPLSISTKLDNGKVAASIYENLPRELHGGQSIVFMLAAQKHELAHEGVFTEGFIEAVHSQTDSMSTDLAEFWERVEQYCTPIQTPRYFTRPKGLVDL